MSSLFDAFLKINRILFYINFSGPRINPYWAYIRITYAKAFKNAFLDAVCIASNNGMWCVITST